MTPKGGIYLLKKLTHIPSWGLGIYESWHKSQKTNRFPILKISPIADLNSQSEILFRIWGYLVLGAYKTGGSFRNVWKVLFQALWNVDLSNQQSRYFLFNFLSFWFWHVSMDPTISLYKIIAIFSWHFRHVCNFAINKDIYGLLSLSRQHRGWGREKYSKLLRREGPMEYILKAIFSVSVWLMITEFEAE